MLRKEINVWADTKVLFLSSQNILEIKIPSKKAQQEDRKEK